jgi:hypothetical protein
MVGLRRFLREHPEWSVVYHAPNNYGLTVISRMSEDKPKMPSLPTMAWNLTKAAWHHARTGRQHASDEVKHERMDICFPCPQRNEHRCSICGCFLDQSPMGEVGKAEWADSECPIGKWGAV